MKELTDQELIEYVAKRLGEDARFVQIADELDIPSSTLHTRLRALGYKTGLHIKPIHPINHEQQAA